MVKVIADVSRKEAPISHIEGHVAEGQQLKEKQNEEEQRQALGNVVRAFTQIVESQACTQRTRCSAHHS